MASRALLLAARLARSRPVAGLALLAALAVPASAQWSVGVGGVPARNSLSQQQGPGAAMLLWAGTSGTTVAQQAVVDGDLAVVNRIFNLGNTLHGTRIEGHDLHTGASLWSVELPVGFADSWRSRVTGIRDGRVYATRSGNTNAEFLYALSPVDGSILWTSDDLITETTTESVSFTADGDIITTGAGAGARLIRIDGATGDTVWKTSGTSPTSGGSDAAVSGNRAYIWQASPAGPILTAVDLATGVKLYSSAAIGGGFIQQVAPFVGPDEGRDGTVYAPRTQNNVLTDFLVAYADTGSALVEQWRSPLGYVPFASFGVGPDGSVYSYSPAREIERRDAGTGALLGKSPPVPSDSSFSPRMAVDALGRVYLTNGSFAAGRLLCYSAALVPLWSEAIAGVNVGGPALGEDGILVACGTASTVRAYRCEGFFMPYASGCPGSGGLTPALSGSGCPSPGETITLAVDGALGGAAAFLLLGTGTGSQVVKGCPVSVLPLLPVAIPLVLGGSGAGNGSLALAAPIPPGAPSVDLYLQVLVADPGAAGGVAGTGPLQLHIQ
ncbi:MAG TPA: PQQ-binding-like beta-propeller repeat protein [Planctomycetota bacterium]|nr:PQQ-binding-like beta-propeller repeat protein [Planctomycetota bacterium]